jgi:hypothetical protein
VAGFEAPGDNYDNQTDAEAIVKTEAAAADRGERQPIGVNA